MKALYYFLPVPFLAFGGAFVGSPYMTASAMVTGIKERDAAAVSENIDYEALRSNLKSQTKSYMLEEIENRMGPEERGPTMLAVGFLDNMIDGMIETVVTPEGLERMMKKAEQADGSKIEYTTAYENYDHFNIRITRDAKGNSMKTPLTLKFERRGIFEWKMVGIEMPFDQMSEYGKQAGDMNAGKVQ